MFKKIKVLFLGFLFTVNSVSAGLVDNNERLKTLLEKAKARESGTTVTNTHPTSPTPTTISPEPIRAPRILSTHPVQEIKSQEKIPEPPSINSSSYLPKVEIKQETKVIQPPVSTLINPQTNSQVQAQYNSSAASKIKTNSNSSTVSNNYDDVLKSIDAIMKGTKAEEMKAPVPKPSQEARSSPAQYSSTVNPNSEIKTSANKSTPSNNYDDVLKSIDSIMKGSKVEEIKTPVPAKTENKNNQTTNPVPTTSQSATVQTKTIENKTLTQSPPINTETSQTPNTKTEGFIAGVSTTAGKEADYLLVLNKSLKSLEQDSWLTVKTNMQEALSYFEKEKKLNSKNSKLPIYAKIILGFQRFGEAGVELDQGDLADFEEAEALYLDCQDNLEEASKELTLANQPSDQEVKSLINKVLQYTEEELNYIEEILGM